VYRIKLRQAGQVRSVMMKVAALMVYIHAYKRGVSRTRELSQ
jgi:hypothetical protein